MNEKQENEENRSFSNIDKVGKAVKQNSVGEYFISTVRLPNAYMFDGKWSLGKYETMIFLKGNAEYMKRCDTLAQAKIQHKEAKKYAVKALETKCKEYTFYGKNLKKFLQKK